MKRVRVFTMNWSYRTKECKKKLNSIRKKVQLFGCQKAITLIGMRLLKRQYGIVYDINLNEPKPTQPNIQTKPVSLKEAKKNRCSERVPIENRSVSIFTKQ